MVALAHELAGSRRTLYTSIGKLTFCIGLLILPASELLAGSSGLDREVRFQIPAQPLDSALIEFSRQARVPVSVNSKLVGDFDAPAVTGTLIASSALAQLLGNSGLAYSTVGNTVTVAPAADVSPSGTQGRSGNRLRLAQAEHGTLRGPSPERSPEERSREKLEEVTVTAQKREERLRDVPISISVLSGSDLDRSTGEGLTEAVNRVPGVAAPLSFGALGVGTQLSIRGVSASEPLFSGSSPIAYYLDSVPFALSKTAIVPDLNAYDLQRVEVLRGPQGTLYGASALNGVVRVLTEDADLNKFGMKARTSISGTDGADGENYRGDVAINVPIVEGKLAARVVGGYQSSSGWINTLSSRGSNEAEIRNMRLKVNSQPTDKLSVGMSAWVSRSDFGGPSVSTETDPEHHVALLHEPQRSDYDTYGVRIGYNLPWFAVTSSTGYLDYSTDGRLDLTFLGLDSTPFDTAISANVFSQEILLDSGPGERVRWSLGGLYRDAKDRFFQDSPLFAAPTSTANISRSTAIFGEVTGILLGGKLELTGGLRYFEDKVRLEEFSNRTGAAAQGVISQATFDKVTPRVVLTWHPGEAVTAYASYAEGFRSGGNSDPPVPLVAPQFATYLPDTLKNYEVGTKAVGWGGRLNLESSVYFIDWQRIQQTLTVDLNGLPLLAILNAKSASGVGVDFGLTVQPVDALTLGLNLSWNDLKLDADVMSGGVALFEKGDRPAYSPETTVGASVEYRAAMGKSGLTGVFSLSGNYTSELDIRRLNATGTAPDIGRGDYVFLARTSFSVRAPQNWEVMLYVDNLTNEDAPSIRVPSAANDFRSRPRPRTVGAQLDFHF